MPNENSEAEYVAAGEDYTKENVRNKVEAQVTAATLSDLLNCDELGEADQAFIRGVNIRLTVNGKYPHWVEREKLRELQGKYCTGKEKVARSKKEKAKRVQSAVELRLQKELLDTLADLRDKHREAYRDWRAGDRELKQAQADVERLTRDVSHLFNVSQDASELRQTAKDEFVFYALCIRKK